MSDIIQIMSDIRKTICGKVFPTSQTVCRNCARPLRKSRKISTKQLGESFKTTATQKRWLTSRDTSHPIKELVVETFYFTVFTMSSHELIPITLR